MREEKKNLNNPKKIFREKGGIETSEKKFPAGMNDFSSVRRSEITSIAPDEINWGKIYTGKRPASRKGVSDETAPK